jgi:hypothetical protein
MILGHPTAHLRSLRAFWNHGKPRRRTAASKAAYLRCAQLGPTAFTDSPDRIEVKSQPFIATTRDLEATDPQQSWHG